MRTRIIVSLVVAALFVLASNLMELYYSPLSGAVTAASLNDSVNSYALAKFIRDGGMNKFMGMTFVLIMLLIWAKPIMNLIRRKRNTVAVAAMTIFGAFMTSCVGPYKTLDVVEVKSNETAWVIPLDAESKDGQVKFNSVGFLDQKKVAAKRIMVDKVRRETGRMPGDYEWISSVRVITVDRSLVTRQWTDGDMGTTKDDEGIGVVTKDSVKLRVGLTVTASIDESDASTYLYYHGARPLREVLDQNIRSFAVAELTKEYSLLSLNEAQIAGDTIYAKLFTDAARAFKTKGITVQYLGNAEGLTYGDPKVQEAINKRYLAEQDAKTAKEEQEAQKVRNATLVLNAQASADAAKKLLEAKEAAEFQNQLRIKMITAEAVNRWDGKLPANVIPANNPLFQTLTGEHK